MRQGVLLNISFEPQLIKPIKLGQLIDICKGNNFRESFEQFEDSGVVSGPFQPAPITQ